MRCDQQRVCKHFGHSYRSSIPPFLAALATMVDTDARNGGATPTSKKPRLSNDEQLTLLTLGDPLGSILNHCDVVSVCRIERTCKALRQSPLVQTHWERLDASVPDKFRGTIGHGGTDRFSRFFRAHEFAKRMEPLLESHLAMQDAEGDFVVQCKGCSAFPDEVCTAIYCEPEKYELFLRCSRKVDDSFLPLEPQHKCEGFVEFRSLKDYKYDPHAGMNPLQPYLGRSLHFQLEHYAPPGFASAIRYIAEKRERAFVENEVKDIVMTLLAMHKETGEIELVTAAVGFKFDTWSSNLSAAGKLSHYMTDMPHSYLSDKCIRTTIGQMANHVSNDGECKVMCDYSG